MVHWNEQLYFLPFQNFSVFVHLQWIKRNLCILDFLYVSVQQYLHLLNISHYLYMHNTLQYLQHFLQLLQIKYLHIQNTLAILHTPFLYETCIFRTKHRTLYKFLHNVHMVFLPQLPDPF